jgi:hypothetical protein
LWETKFHTHTKWHVKLWFWVFSNLYVFRLETEGQEHPNRTVASTAWI